MLIIILSQSGRRHPLFLHHLDVVAHTILSDSMQDRVESLRRIHNASPRLKALSSSANDMSVNLSS
jgi:hypothetical protein